MTTFAVRLLDDGPDARFVYYDNTEERAGNVPREVTCEWSDHDLPDLDRVMSMLAMMGHAFEVRGLIRVDDPFAPQGYRWDVNPRSRKATSPRALHDAALAELEAEAARVTMEKSTE